MCRVSKKYVSVSEGYFKKNVDAITFKAILGLHSLLSFFESLLENQMYSVLLLEVSHICLK